MTQGFTTLFWNAQTLSIDKLKFILTSPPVRSPFAILICEARLSSLTKVFLAKMTAHLFYNWWLSSNDELLVIWSQGVALVNHHQLDFAGFTSFKVCDNTISVLHVHMSCTSSERSEQFQTIGDWIANSDYSDLLICGGDFNGGSSERAESEFSSLHCLTDTWLHAFPRLEGFTHFPTIEQDENLIHRNQKRRLDKIYTNFSAAVQSVQVFKCPGKSDHAAVLATFSVTQSVNPSLRKSVKRRRPQTLAKPTEPYLLPPFTDFPSSRRCLKSIITEQATRCPFGPLYCLNAIRTDLLTNGCSAGVNRCVSELIKYMELSYPPKDNYHVTDIECIQRQVRLQDIFRHGSTNTMRDTARDIAKVLFKPKKVSLILSDGPNTAPLSNIDIIIERLCEFTKRKFSTEHDRCTLSAFDNMLNSNHVLLSPLTDAEKSLTDPLSYTTRDIRRYVDKLKRNKAAGPDGITYEHIQCVAFEEHLLCIMRSIIHAPFPGHSAYLFPNLLDSFISYIPKVKSPCTVGELRPIALQNTIAKVISGLMASKLNEVAIKLAGDHQFGFVPLRQSLILPHLVQKCYDCGDIIILLDLKGAFDTVKGTKVLRTLRALNLHNNALTLIQFFLNPYDVQVGANGSFSTEKIRIRKGLKQGDPMSPLLFNVIASLIPKFIPHRLFKYFLQFADDIAIIINRNTSATDFQSLIAHLTTILDLLDLELNLAKSIMLGKDIPPHISDLQWAKISPSAKYLGIQVGACFNDGATVKLKTMTNMVNMCKSWHLPLSMRVSLWNTFIAPKIVYLLTIWPLSDSFIKDAEHLLRLLIGSFGKSPSSYVGPAYAIITSPVASGGLGALDLVSLNYSTKAKWINITIAMEEKSFLPDWLKLILPQMMIDLTTWSRTSVFTQLGPPPWKNNDVYKSSLADRSSNLESLQLVKLQLFLAIIDRSQLRTDQENAIWTFIMGVTTPAEVWSSRFDACILRPCPICLQNSVWGPLHMLVTSPSACWFNPAIQSSLGYEWFSRDEVIFSLFDMDNFELSMLADFLDLFRFPRNPFLMVRNLNRLFGTEYVLPAPATRPTRITAKSEFKSLLKDPVKVENYLHALRAMTGTSPPSHYYVPENFDAIPTSAVTIRRPGTNTILKRPAEHLLTHIYKRLKLANTVTLSPLTHTSPSHSAPPPVAASLTPIIQTPSAITQPDPLPREPRAHEPHRDRDRPLTVRDVERLLAIPVAPPVRQMNLLTSRLRAIPVPPPTRSTLSPFIPPEPD